MIDLALIWQWLDDVRAATGVAEVTASLDTAQGRVTLVSDERGRVIRAHGDELVLVRRAA